ncbi:MAG TPA: aldehyde ferredoxin oxidoreductase family protein [Anaerolineales bacterium]|nr:aldehyde ferredoxin oxidoreductase family protein [Anaerolineales bacterium]
MMVSKMKHTFGKILRVDLEKGSFQEFQVEPDWIQDYIGGSGLAARLLWADLTPDIDPLGPSNPLLFITGPFTGVSGPATSRFMICAKSPATGLWGESNCGGLWGPELRFAGYDGVLITGKSAHPVFLWINDGKAELRSAAHLWGTADTYQTQQLIRQELGESKARVACIGLAGERQIPYAMVLCDHGRVAGRTGMGAVMGSKKLKAIAVRGSGKLTIAHPEDFQPLRSIANKELREENTSRSLRASGSGSGAELFQIYGEQPSLYFTGAEFEGQENVSGNVMAETILSGVTTCHACVIACGRLVTIQEGPYERPESKGPEYETMMGFGSILGSGDMEAATHLGQICDTLGLDTISTSNVIGLAYLMFARGHLSSEDTGGLQLHWGDPAPAETLIHWIVQEEGIGRWMRNGARSFAAHFGVEELAAQVNNLEIPYHDPRAFSGMAIVYATSPRGACHNQGDFFMAEIGASHEDIGIPVLTPPTPDEGKARLVAIHQNYRTMTNSLGICLFSRVPVTHQVELLNSLTGLEMSLDDFLNAGERAWNLKRMINHRLGLTKVNDKLPKLLLTPLTYGLHAGQSLDMERLMADYYAARGWDPDTGHPTREKLISLNLGFSDETGVS